MNTGSCGMKLQTPIQLVLVIQWPPKQHFCRNIINWLFFVAAPSSEQMPCDDYIRGCFTFIVYETHAHINTNTHTHICRRSEDDLKEISGSQYRQFLDKKFKQVLVIRSPDIKHSKSLWGISNTCFNMRKVTWHRLLMHFLWADLQIM